MRRRTLALGMLLAALSWACGEDDPGRPDDDEPTAVSGTVRYGNGEPVVDVWVHLVHGSSAVQTWSASDEVDGQGGYRVVGTVPEERCHTVRLVVMSGSAWSAALPALGDTLVGACGETALDVRVELFAPGL